MCVYLTVKVNPATHLKMLCVRVGSTICEQIKCSIFCHGPCCCVLYCEFVNIFIQYVNRALLSMRGGCVLVTVLCHSFDTPQTDKSFLARRSCTYKLFFTATNDNIIEIYNYFKRCDVVVISISNNDGPIE